MRDREDPSYQLSVPSLVDRLALIVYVFVLHEKRSISSDRPRLDLPRQSCLDARDRLSQTGSQQDSAQYFNLSL
ncbi:hypothetical protein ACJ72_04944 [Emergomyces africanus]|uniref:Uncharacterized protein n=1 Tax=Emergomyces africanus TaxID=1955775 RepID=A0A1B7NVF2_9EURO|nr:hypothetical protein ACJ72_04944 [Emergomyces africanus]